jgi:membrane protein required for colicin V production
LTQFDLIVLGLLLLSAVVGFARGALREIVAMVALIVGALAAIAALPMTSPIAHKFTHSTWLAAVAALIVVFCLVYMIVRLLGAGLAHGVHRTDFMGLLDRTAGLVIGVVRGLAALGVLYLMFNAATPEELRPHWITGAMTWPLAQASGQTLADLTPRGLDMAGKLKPRIEQAFHGDKGDRNATDGYDAPQRRHADEETSR